MFPNQAIFHNEWNINGMQLSHPKAMLQVVTVATKSIFICTTPCSGLRTACRGLWALSSSEWIFFLPLSQLNGPIAVVEGVMCGVVPIAGVAN